MFSVAWVIATFILAFKSVLPRCIWNTVAAGHPYALARAESLSAEEVVLPVLGTAPGQPVQQSQGCCRGFPWDRSWRDFPATFPLFLPVFLPTVGSADCLDRRGCTGWFVSIFFWFCWELLNCGAKWDVWRGSQYPIVCHWTQAWFCCFSGRWFPRLRIAEFIWICFLFGKMC